MALETDKRGPFAVGEIPEDIVMRFKRPESLGGGPVDLSATGWDAELDITDPSGTTVTKEAVISNGAEGEVRYTFVEGDFSQDGTYKLLFWAYSGTEPETVRLASKVIELQVFNPPKLNGS